MTREVDVLIIGAGPAGLCTGIVCARNGLETLVCEQKRLPVDKACGEGIMPGGVDYLERLGVKQYLPTGEFRPFIGVRYYSDGLMSASGIFRKGPGLGIRRTVLSTALSDRAAEFDNMTICEKTPARPVRREAGKIWVKVGDELVLARLLVGADGLHSQVRRWAGLQGRPVRNQRWGARQHFVIEPWSDFVEVHWADNIEAYITPCDEKQVGVAFLWNRSRFHNIQGGKELIPALLQSFPQLQKRLKGAVTDGPVRAAGPFEQRVRAPAANGTLLVGDASGYLDAITGEGISLAAAQALAVEDTVVPLLKGAKGELTVKKLESYIQTHNKITKPYYQITHLALFFSYHPVLARRAIAALSAQPDLFQHLLSASMGYSHIWPGLRLTLSAVRDFLFQPEIDQAISSRS